MHQASLSSSADSSYLWAVWYAREVVWLSLCMQVGRCTQVDWSLVQLCRQGTWSEQALWCKPAGLCILVKQTVQAGRLVQRCTPVAKMAERGDRLVWGFVWRERECRSFLVKRLERAGGGK